MAKIAVNSRRAPAGHSDAPGSLEARTLARGEGWTVEDVVCTRGPQDPRFEEQHDTFVIAIVTSGTFQYRSSGSNREEVMTPGSVLLGSPGQCFECGHEHGVGDRCLAFHFATDYFDHIVAGGGTHQTLKSFHSSKLSAFAFRRERFSWMRRFNRTVSLRPRPLLPGCPKACGRLKNGQPRTSRWCASRAKPGSAPFITSEHSRASPERHLTSSCYASGCGARRFGWRPSTERSSTWRSKQALATGRISTAPSGQSLA